MVCWTFSGHSCDGFCMQTCEPEREGGGGGREGGREGRGREEGREVRKDRGREREGGRERGEGGREGVDVRDVQYFLGTLNSGTQPTRIMRSPGQKSLQSIFYPQKPYLVLHHLHQSHLLSLKTK